MSSAYRHEAARIFAASAASRSRSSALPRVPISPRVRSRMPVRWPSTAIFNRVPPQVCSTSSRCAAIARISSEEAGILSCSFVSRATQRAPGTLIRYFAVEHDWLAVHQNVLNADGIVKRLVVGGLVLHLFRIEDCDIREHSRSQNAPVDDSHAACCLRS